MSSQESIMIKNAYSYYAILKSPGKLKYKKKADPSNALVNKEYIIEVLLRTKDLKILKKKWMKRVVLLQKTKFYTAEEFKANFNVDPPADELYETTVEEIDEDDNEYEVTQYETIKLRKYASWPNGDPTPLVELFGCVNKRKVERSGISVTQQAQDEYTGEILGGVSTAVGNGSLVTIQCGLRELKPELNEDQWQFDLSKVQVLDLVEYVSKEMDDGDFADEDADFDEEGMDEGDFADEEGEVEEVVAPKVEAKPKKKAAPKKKKAAPIEDDDDF